MPEKKYKRICPKCQKEEMVASKAQVSRSCRSCSKLGNTSSQNMTAETRQKIRASKLGSTPWNKGQTGVYSEESRQLMGADKLGKRQSQQTRERKSATLKAFYQEHTSHRKGAVRSAEQKAKTSATLSAKKAERSIHTAESLQSFLTPFNITLLEREGSTPLSQQDFVALKCSCERLYTRKVQTITNGGGGLCDVCGSSSSKPEQEILKFVKDLLLSELVESRARVNGAEMDIYIASRSLAIEFHGLAHHSERPVFGPKDRVWTQNRHQKKYRLCKDVGVRLIQIFEDEWRDKQELVKAMISTRLGISHYKIPARDLAFRRFEPEDIRTVQEFFKKYHISGSTAASFGGGLYMGEVLVCALTFRKPRGYGAETIEIARFATQQGVSVAGGFSKLMHYLEPMCKEKGFSQILTYADCRFGSGDVYLKTGFDHVGTTKPNYFYERGGIRESRQKHRKQEGLPGQTEREQQNALGWYAIYDAGNEIYLKKI